MDVNTIVQKHVLEHVLTLAIKVVKAIVVVHAKVAKGHVKKVAKTHVKIVVKALV